MAAPENLLMCEQQNVQIYTDGACQVNPGPGGYAAILLCGSARKEITGGCRLTTNNRMEMLAVIAGLESLTRPCRVTVLSDSQYVVRAMTEGWAARWRVNGWKRNRKESAENRDLWAKLLDLCAVHQVTFEWVQGHAGETENESCDRLAVAAAARENLPPDVEYEQKLSQVTDQPSLF